MDREEILRLLPHRPPFLMVDRVVELTPGERIVAAKDIRDDAWWAPAHFPNNPVFPGVLQVEALAQTAALLVFSTEPERAGGPVYLVGMDRFRFRRMVRPGEVLKLEVSVASQRRGFWGFDAVASVDGEVAASGTFLATGERG